MALSSFAGSVASSSSVGGGTALSALLFRRSLVLFRQHAAASGVGVGGGCSGISSSSFIIGNIAAAASGSRCCYYGLAAAAASSAVLMATTTAASSLAVDDDKDDFVQETKKYYNPFYFRSNTILCEEAAAAAASSAAPPAGGWKKSKEPPSSVSNLRKRMTHIGYFSILSETPSNPSIPVGVMELTGDEPFTKDDLVKLWNDRGLSERHDRFAMRQSPTAAGYFEPKPKPDNSTKSSSIEQHVTETVYPAAAEYKKDLAARLVELQTTPWDLTKELWHAYVCHAKVPSTSSSGRGQAKEGADDHPAAAAAAAADREQYKSLLVFRSHHVLADGSTMMSAWSELSDEYDEMAEKITKLWKDRKRRILNKDDGMTWWDWLRVRLLSAWKFFVGSLSAVLYQGKLLYLDWRHGSPWKILQQEAAEQDGDDAIANRVLSWTSAGCSVDQVKWVAAVLGGSSSSEEGGGSGGEEHKKKNITVNDIFLSCVCSALAKQLHQHRQHRDCVQAARSQDGLQQESLPRQPYMHIAIPVHLTGGVIIPGQSTLSNMLGAFTVRLPGEVASSSGDGSSKNAATAAVGRLLSVHEAMHDRKQTTAPVLAHFAARCLAVAAPILPARWTAGMYSRASAGACAVLTNARGAAGQQHLAGRRIENAFGFVPLPAGVPVGVVVLSQAEKITLSVAAERWAVPNPDLFLSWVLEEYLSLAAAAKEKVQQET